MLTVDGIPAHPLVIHAVAAPRADAAAVVVRGYEVGGDLLAHAAGVDARALLHRVGLEAVPDRRVPTA